MENKTYQMKKIYDSKYDILVIKIENHYDFGKTIEMEEGVLLDFDKNNIPVSIEILDLSRLLNVDKKNLINVDAEMKIICNEDVLKVTLNFAYNLHNKNFNETLNFKIANNYNIPIMETELITA